MLHLPAPQRGENNRSEASDSTCPLHIRPSVQGKGLQQPRGVVFTPYPLQSWAAACALANSSSIARQRGAAQQGGAGSVPPRASAALLPVRQQMSARSCPLTLPVAGQEQQ